MPYVTINESPLVQGRGAVEVHYRRVGEGRPLVFLHGGWGYEIYPFDRQIEAFKERFSIVIADRSGYGRSARISHLPSDFHARAARETESLLDALGLHRPVLWGHSDGAVIATLMGLSSPDRFDRLILEAFHYYRVKPSSRAFFDGMVSRPDNLGERVASILANEHGEDYWQKLIQINGLAWAALSDESEHTKQDLYGGRLSGLRVPAIFIHGSRDPRTEPDELEAVEKELPKTPIHIIEGAGHSPHSERAAASECNRIASEFLA